MNGSGESRTKEHFEECDLLFKMRFSDNLLVIILTILRACNYLLDGGGAEG
jgi:hypothetical protein